MCLGGHYCRVYNRYTPAFNRQQGRRGTLFEGRASSVLVDTDSYIVHLCRYMHLNPVRAGLVSHPGQWAYSNYLEWVERRAGTLVDRAFVRQYFPTPADYEAFVMSEVDPGLEEKLQPYYLE